MLCDCCPIYIISSISMSIPFVLLKIYLLFCCFVFPSCHLCLFAQGLNHVLSVIAIIMMMMVILTIIIIMTRFSPSLPCPL